MLWLQAWPLFSGFWVKVVRLLQRVKLGLVAFGERGRERRKARESKKTIKKTWKSNIQIK